MHFERRGGVTPLLIRRGVSVPIQPLERPLVMNKIHDGCGVMEGFPFIVGVGIARPRIKRDVSENRRALPAPTNAFFVPFYQNDRRWNLSIRRMVYRAQQRIIPQNI